MAHWDALRTWSGNQIMQPQFLKDGETLVSARVSEPWQQLVTPPEAPHPREPAANPPLNPRSSCLMAEDTL